MWQLLSKHWKLVVLWGIIIGLVSLGVSLFFPKQYSAASSVLIISRDRAGIDPYTQAKSAERIGQNLAQVMKTTDFYNKVMENAADVDQSAWKNLSDREQRKKWQKDVRAEMIFGGSLLRVTAYGKSYDDALALAKSVTQTVTSRGWEYVGGDVALKTVDSPLVSRWPARPNLGLNAAVGVLVGLLLASLWVVRYRRAIFGRW